MSIANQVLAAMESYGPTREKPNQYRYKSNPFRPASDSASFVLTIKDDTHGAWYDHVADAGGSLYQLANHLGIETPRREVETSKRSYNGLKDYAQAHGITEDDLLKAGWTEETHKGRPALRFRTKTGSRYRFLDGDKPHYVSNPGYKKSWYGLHERFLTNLLRGGPVVICNGEISVVSGRVHGLNALCVTAGEAAIPEHLLQELADALGEMDFQILVAMDCDAKGRKVAATVTQQLIEAGFSAKAIDLGLTDGGDLADFCRLHGETAAQDILACPDLDSEANQGDKPSLPGLTELPKECVLARGQGWLVMKAADLDKLPMIDWLVKGEIPKRGLTTIYGPSGTGKSFLALDYALRIAEQGNVLYMAGEGEYGYQARIAAWMRHHKPEYPAQDRLYMSLGAVSFMEGGDLDHFMQSVGAIKPELIIVDTLVRSMVGADENSTRDMNSFTDRCRHLIYELGCAVLVVHHTNKGGIIERGSGVLRAASDVMIRLTDEDGTVRVECEKTKESKPFNTRHMTLLPIDTGLIDAEGQAVHTPVMIDSGLVLHTDADALTKNQQKVLEALDMTIFTEGASMPELVDVVPDVHRTTVWRALERLMKLDLVAQDAKRDPYAITDKGRERLQQLRSLKELQVNSSQEASLSERETTATTATNANNAINNSFNTSNSDMGDDINDADIFGFDGNESPNDSTTPDMFDGQDDLKKPPPRYYGEGL